MLARVQSMARSSPSQLRIWPWSASHTPAPASREHPFMPVEAFYLDDPDGNEIEIATWRG